MSHELSDEQVEKLKQAFDNFDKDGNGTITTDEVSNVMTSIGQQSPSEEELEEFIQQMGGEDGRVRFDQFLKFMAKFMNAQ